MNTENLKETDFVLNDNLIINNFDFVDSKIHEFMKFGELQPYKEFRGEIEGKKVKGFVCLNDDNIYKLESI